MITAIPNEFLTIEETVSVTLCNWCRSVYFCRKHHSIHRKQSKCSPYVIGDGKKLLASRDIKAG